jgi:hypothetical protein
MRTVNNEIADSVVHHTCLRGLIEAIPRLPSASNISEASTVSTVETATSTLSFDERRRTQCMSLASQGEKDLGSNVEQEDFLCKRSDTSKHVCFSRSPPRHVVTCLYTEEGCCEDNHCRSTHSRLDKEESEELHIKNQLLRSFSYSTPSTGGVGWKSTSSRLSGTGNDKACHEAALFASILS